jgi:hypothetical protein
MWYKITANGVVLLHFAFILFVLFGALFVVRWNRLAWLHIPAALWGALVELKGWICPLTPLENRLWLAAGADGYSGGFIEHYLIPLIYPPGLTRGIQLILGFAVILINALVYIILLGCAYKRRKEA